jgi:nanoRNase/pAp phosphatase (c-di-AMP/oligoRNAs hydrolase)
LSFINNFKDKNIYHISDADTDGLGATILGIYYLKPVVKNIEFLITGDRELELFNWDIANNSDIIIFTDIAPPSLDFYNKIEKQVFIFDHHSSHRDFLGDLKNYFYNDANCASRIFFEKLTENNRANRVVKEFIDLVDCYDCWHDDNILWKKANELNLLRSASINWYCESDFDKNYEFIQAMLFKFEKLKKFNFTYKEIRLISSEKFKENNRYNEAKDSLQIRVDNKGNKYIYMEALSKISAIANRFLKEYNDIKYVLARSTFRDAINNLSLSLRSVGDFNVANIAEKWGGGGHKNASGIAMKNKEDYLDVMSGKLHLL